MTHRTTAKDAPSHRLAACRETAAMFEQNMLRDDTSDVVSRTWNFGDASSLVHRARHSAGLLDRVSSLSPREIDLGCSAARAWASAGSNSQQAGPSRQSGVRRLRVRQRTSDFSSLQ